MALSSQAVRSIFFTLDPVALASVLNNNEKCRRTLNKSSITAKLLNTYPSRQLVYAKLRPLLERELCEALQKAWEEQYQVTIDEVLKLKVEDESALSAFVRELPRWVREVLVALDLLPAELDNELDDLRMVTDLHVVNTETERQRAALDETKGLKKELATLRKQLKVERERHGRELEKLRHELVTCRKRLAETRRRLGQVEEELAARTQERTTAHHRIASLEKQLYEKGREIDTFREQVEQLQADLTVAQDLIRQACTAAEAAELEKQRALVELQDTRERRPCVDTQTLLSLLLAAPNDREKEMIDYSAMKANRDVQRALADATEAAPTDLLKVWSQWLREEEETITLLTRTEELSSLEEVHCHLTHLLDLDYQMNLRLSLVRRLRLAMSRLMVYYEEKGSNHVVV